MQRGLEVDWDDDKSELLKRSRGFGFEQVVNLFRSFHAVARKNDDPEQFAAIGFVEGRLITCIYEQRESDSDGIEDIIWLVTYWKSTVEERKYYEREAKKAY
jgi:uncharacterized DUF497 family protein